MSSGSEAGVSPVEVPTIDVDRRPDVVGREIDETLRSVGFFQIVGHGVDAAVADRCWDVTREFFDLPLDEKLRVQRQPGGLYGYFPIESESLAQSVDGTSAGDLKESMNVGAGDFAPPRHRFADETEAALFARSTWPRSLPELRTAWGEYFQQMTDLADRLMRVFALGLGLRAEHFARMIDRAPTALRAINYPPRAAAPGSGQLRAGAHTDYGTLTILRQQSGRGGLQVWDEKADSWVEVPPAEGAYVINIGDLMARWTNDRWTSTLHRVVNPDEGGSAGPRRQSMPFFHNANYDQVVECLPTCIADGVRYPPVAAGPHLAQKARRSQVASG